ncbi:MAG: [FeFe] hydrogenase H-cluster radical SAM maturase HydE [Oscillospiraceae bacterium]
MEQISQTVLTAYIDRLERERTLTADEFSALVEFHTPALAEYVAQKARTLRAQYYDNDVYMRGLIEFTNYCKNDCFYCGIRRSNTAAERYRLTKDDILACAAEGYQLGFRTFVLQGGEDPFFTDERLTEIVSALKAAYPDCAVTLSVGERSFESYKKLYDAGADRYLLRHETADEAHYATLHPAELTLENRKRCLFDLKKIGFEVGTGFMVGSPHQTPQTIAKDLLFLRELLPQMVGIGPFIPHADTPLKSHPAGSAQLTTFLLSLIRIMLPNVLLPATTALGTIDPAGREKGILSGANVVMPNLSPVAVRKKYMLYDNKICTGDEAAECRFCMQRRVESIGYKIAVCRGDWKSEVRSQKSEVRR